MKRYLLIQIEERNGEQEYMHPYLTTYSGKKSNDEIADNIASKWYDTNKGKRAEKFNDYYEFEGGSLLARVKSVREIPKEHFDILQLYGV